MSIDLEKAAIVNEAPNEKVICKDITPEEELVHNIEASRMFLKYSLRISLPVKFSADGSLSPELIDKIAEDAFLCCEPFFSEKNQFFFGMDASISEGLFSSPTKYRDMWRRILKDDAVVTFYSRLRDMASLNSKVFTSKAMECMYEETSFGKNPRQPYGRIEGTEYLISQGIINLDDSTFSYSVQEESSEESGSRMTKRIMSNNKSYRETLSRLDDFFKTEGIRHDPFVSEDEKLFLGNLEYPGIIRGLSKGIAAFLKFYKPNYQPTHPQFLDFAQACESIIQKLNNSVFEKADRIYAINKIEEELHIGLGNCLYRNIVCLEKDLETYLHENNKVDVLASCVKLPNTLTRHLIVNSAFDVLRGVHNTIKIPIGDFFYSVADDLRRTVVSFNTADTYVIPYDWWLRQYERVISYLGNFVFPVYESLFMAILYKIEEDSSPDDSIKKRLSTILRALGEYINKTGVYDGIYSRSAGEPVDDVQKLFAQINRFPVDYSKDVIDKKPRNLPLFSSCVSSMMQYNSAKGCFKKAPFLYEHFEKLIPYKDFTQKVTILQIAGYPGFQQRAQRPPLSSL